MVLGGCLVVVGRLSGRGWEGVGRLFEGFGEVVWRVWESCLDGVGRLSKRSGRL